MDRDPQDRRAGEMMRQCTLVSSPTAVGRYEVLDRHAVGLRLRVPEPSKRGSGRCCLHDPSLPVRMMPAADNSPPDAQIISATVRQAAKSLSGLTNRIPAVSASISIESALSLRPGSRRVVTCAILFPQPSGSPPSPCRHRQFEFPLFPQASGDRSRRNLEGRVPAALRALFPQLSETTPNPCGQRQIEFPLFPQACRWRAVPLAHCLWGVAHRRCPETPGLRKPRKIAADSGRSVDGRQVLEFA
jgi:hypothetical protein